jgi:hypothetical protein
MPSVSVTVFGRTGANVPPSACALANCICSQILRTILLRRASTGLMWVLRLAVLNFKVLNVPMSMIPLFVTTWTTVISVCRDGRPESAGLFRILV